MRPDCDIHPTALVDPGAEIGAGVVIEAYACVSAGVTLGDRCLVRHHATVEGPTILGEENVLYPYAYVGGQTQDLKYDGGTTSLRIGNGNTFREFCTVHRATPDGQETVIGDDNLFLAYTHIAHDCRVGNGVIMSNNGTLAGHVTLGDHAVVGGLTAVHQFCRIGEFAMLGGCAKVVQDVPPYMIADGHPAHVRTINKIGMERHGLDDEARRLAERAHRILYREGLNRTQALERLRAERDDARGTLARLIAFVEQTERGLA